MLEAAQEVLRTFRARTPSSTASAVTCIRFPRLYECTSRCDSSAYHKNGTRFEYKIFLKAEIKCGSATFKIENE
jgi:hypothetical protein